MGAKVIPFPGRARKESSADNRREAKQQALRAARHAENRASPKYDRAGHNPPWCERCLLRPAVTYCHCRDCCGETKLCHPCDKAHQKAQAELL